MLENSLDDYVADTAQSTQRRPIVGTVTKVYARDTESARGNHEVNVVSRAFTSELRRVPVVLTDHDGHVNTLTEGDSVFVQFLGGSSPAPVVTGFVPNNENRVPLTRPGHWRHEWYQDSGEHTYLEAERADHSAGTPDLVRMGVKPDGLADPSTEVAVDNSSDTTEVRVKTDGNITVQADGDITLQADGDIVIDNGETTKPVLTADATFEYEDTTISDTETGSGSASTQTKETSTVTNGETTNTKLS